MQKHIKHFHIITGKKNLPESYCVFCNAATYTDQTQLQNLRKKFKQKQRPSQRQVFNEWLVHI